MTDFASLIRTLAQNHVEFMLVGGAAATVHGSARLTQDRDKRSVSRTSLPVGCRYARQRPELYAGD